MSGLPALTLTLLVALPLGCFAARRILLIGASLLHPRLLPPPPAEPPSLTLLVAARNEGGTIRATFEALDAVDYPPHLIRLVLIDDASEDATGEELSRFAALHPRARALRLPYPVGKAQALNEGLAAVPSSELVGVCDADHRPLPDCFLRLAGAFEDKTVGAAAGFLRPANAGATPIAHYAAVEAWVHQLVTSAGKDRLDLNPPTLGGACVYRRRALEEVGGFRPAALGEDVESTLALTSSGWRTRFVPDAVAGNIVVHRWSDYWHQHIRWARSLFDSATRHRPAVRGRPRLRHRLEMWMLAAGYSDRLFLLAAAGLSGAGAVSPWIPLAYVGLQIPAVLVGLVKAGAGSRSPAYLGWTIAFFALDIVASLAAMVVHLRRAPREWVRAPRRPETAPPAPLPPPQLLRAPTSELTRGSSGAPRGAPGRVR